MNPREILRRLEAHGAGRPLPTGTTRTVHVAEGHATLIVAFIRMGGESRPWGVAWGTPGTTAQVRVASDARRREEVAEALTDFTSALRTHLGMRDDGTAGAVPGVGHAPLPQVWLPNDAHLEMIHLLAVANAAPRSASAISTQLAPLGRACNFLHLEAQRPGQQTVVVATSALRDAFTFPAQDLRQGHLGFLLAWLETSGDRDDRDAAARRAERRAMGTSLDPELEADLAKVLAPRPSRRGSPRPEGQSAGSVERLRHRLEDELRHRFDLVERARDVLRTDPRPVNSGVTSLVDSSRHALDWYLGKERPVHEDGIGAPRRPFLPSALTDNDPLAAATRYHRRVKAAIQRTAALVHDDAELQARIIAEGEGFRGRLVAHRELESRWGRSDELELVVDGAGPMKTREQDVMLVVGAPGSEARVTTITEDPSGGRTIVVEAKGLGQVLQWLAVGKELALISHGMPGILDVKVKLNDTAASGPGAWLTHRRPASHSTSESWVEGSQDEGVGGA